jgi:hypothetical protein
MTRTSGDAPQLYQELWISFAALLKSFAAAVSLALPGGAMKISDRDGCGLQFCTASKVLEIAFDSQSGSGQWSIKSLDGSTTASSGAFVIDRAGTVSLDGIASGSPMEMDAAAETLAARIL